MKNAEPIKRGAAAKTNYKQYFDESSDEEEIETGSGKASGKMGQIQKAKPRQNGRKRDINSDEDSSGSGAEGESSLDEEDVSEPDEDEGRWNDKCFVCSKTIGKMLCCESCPNVAHFKCANFLKEPTGDWHCMPCMVKLNQRRTTRGLVTQNNDNQIMKSSSGRTLRR